MYMIKSKKRFILPLESVKNRAESKSIYIYMNKVMFIVICMTIKLATSYFVNAALVRL